MTPTAAEKPGWPGYGTCRAAHSHKTMPKLYTSALSVYRLCEITSGAIHWYVPRPPVSGCGSRFILERPKSATLTHRCASTSKLPAHTWGLRWSIKHRRRRACTRWRCSCHRLQLPLSGWRAGWLVCKNLKRRCRQHMLSVFATTPTARVAGSCCQQNASAQAPIQSPFGSETGQQLTRLEVPMENTLRMQVHHAFSSAHAHEVYLPPRQVNARRMQ
jgi:hypothetical protein